MISLTFQIPGKLIRLESQTISEPKVIKTDKSGKVIKNVDIYHAPLVQATATQKIIISDEAQEFFQKMDSKPSFVKPKEWNAMSAKKRLEFQLELIAGSKNYEYEILK